MKRVITITLTDGDLIVNYDHSLPQAHIVSICLLANALSILLNVPPTEVVGDDSFYHNSKSEKDEK